MNAKGELWIAICLVLLPLAGFGLISCGDDDDDVNNAKDDDAGDDDVTDDDNSGDDDNDDDNDDDTTEGPKIAVISDMHLWYPDTELGDGETEPTYPALMSHEALEYIRNEGPDILRAAIADAIDRGARYIVLNGDFGNENERAVYASVTEELKEYEENYEVDFLFVRGNHDTSNNENHETGEANEVTLFQGSLENDWTYSIGALELYEYFKPYGMTATDVDGSPEEYLYWERGPETENGCGTLDPDGECVTQTQFSYLVEPFEGIWLLILDTNGFSENGGDSGWGEGVLATAKPRTFEWIENVYERAAAQGKSVITFGHHNLGDPLCGLTFEKFGFLEGLFGTKQSVREMAEIGTGIYVSGHLHMDYIFENADNSSKLIDIQVPSLANYGVGYRLFTFGDEAVMNVETINVRDVPNWDRYLSYYQTYAEEGEWEYEKFEVELSTTFEEFVNRTFRNMVSVKINGEVGADVLSLLKLVSLFKLLQLGDSGKALDLQGLEDLISQNVPLPLSGGEKDLVEDIVAAGLSVDTFKKLSLYDFVFVMVDIQFGGGHAFVKMDEAGTREYYEFLLERLQNKKLVAIDHAPSDKCLSLLAFLLDLLCANLNEFFWDRPYLGKVQIDLNDLSIAELP